jgi:hypothetical protein
MRDQRELFRIGVHRKAFLRRREDVTICEICDLTEKGLQLATEISMVIGETVALEFQLIDRKIIHCVLLITHGGPLRAGGRIIHISTEDREALIASSKRNHPLQPRRPGLT